MARVDHPLEDWILQLPNVTSAPHRFGGTEYKVHNLEFMHSHGPRYLDIRLSMEDQARVLKEGKAERHRFAPQAGWVTFRIHSEGDLEAAKELIRLAYDNARRLMADHESKRSGGSQTTLSGTQAMSLNESPEKGKTWQVFSETYKRCRIWRKVMRKQS